MSISGALLAEAAWKFVRSRVFLYLAAGVLTYGVFKWNEWNIDYLRKQNAKLVQENLILKSTIEETHKNYKKVTESLKIAVQERQKSISELEKLRKSLYRENQGKKSLEELADSKSKLVEKRINDATQKTLRCIEKISKGLSCED